MSEKNLRRLLIFCTLFGGALTLAHFFYITEAYQHCSIIYFIAKELW